uniref:Uncharacterized protein n=1 Tax=Solanum lycopersicum TaxID=4081 RepID=A0A3Q7GIL9_SOLLC
MVFSVMSTKNDQHWFLHLVQKVDSEVVRSKIREEEIFQMRLFINFVLALTIKNMILAAPSKDIVIVIG